MSRHMMKAEDILRIYAGIRSIVPQNINLDMNKEYWVELTDNRIEICDGNSTIYLCYFKARNYEKD